MELGSHVIGVDVTGARMAPGVQPVIGDTRHPEEWARHLHDVGVVVHTAALVSNVAGRKQAWEVNVLGTSRTLKAAQAAGVNRFVHLSSIAAFGFDFPPDVDESYPAQVNGHSYTDTKVNGEAVVLAAHAAGEIDVVVVRPGDVYGPESRPWVELPLQIIQARQAVLPRGGRGIFSPAYVDNVVDGLLLASSSPGAAGRIYTLTDGKGVSCSEYFGRLAAMCGGRIRTMPAAPATVLAASLGALQRSLRRPSELSVPSMKMLDRPGTYSIERARRELGFEPLIDLDEGMRRTEAWARSVGLIGA